MGPLSTGFGVIINSGEQNEARRRGDGDCRKGMGMH